MNSVNPQPNHNNQQSPDSRGANQNKQTNNKMKTLKTLLAGLLALTCVSMAKAQTKVYLTGSTAFRGNTYAAITHIYDPGFTFGYTGDTLSGAGQAIFDGNIGGQRVIIKTDWTGSEGGIQTVAGQVAIAFLPDSTPVSVAGTANATKATSDNGGEVKIPDIAMSDTFQSSSAYFGVYKGKNYPTLTESPNSPVGVVPFKFLASKGSTLTNITADQARALFGAGVLPLAFFTGNSGDKGTTVVATGRDPDSGTRVTELADIGLGSQANVKHWQPQDGSGNLVKTIGTPIAKYAPWPATTINGIAVSVFNGGFSSGGDLTKAIANTVPAGTILLSYAGTGDADKNALPNGAVELSFNGVKLGTPASGQTYGSLSVLTEGEYTFWGYEHLYYRSSTSGTAAGNVADKIANQIRTVDSPVLLSAMKVQRNTDGSVVLPSYNTKPPPQ